jgi:hypothetical protein
MRIEQAVFTSACTSRMLGYHLVARSEGIRNDLERDLSPWCPSHASLLAHDLDASSLSFFPVGAGHIALARTVYGAPEYSNRGSLQIVTMLLVLRNEQLAGYDFNALALARTTLALGHLWLNADPPERLPSLDIPDHSQIGQHPPSPSTPGEQAAVQAAACRLQQQRHVALVGLPEPAAAVEQVLLGFPGRRRLEISFTTGLKPSAQRTFRLHAYPALDDSDANRLASLGVECLAV